MQQRSGFGTIFTKKGSPYLYIRWKVGSKACERSTHSTSREVAQKQLEKVQTQIEDGTHVSAGAKRVTFEKLMELVVSDYLDNNTSLVKKLVDGKVVLSGSCWSSVQRLKTFFGGMRALAINKAKITEYSNVQREAGYAKATIGNDIRILKRAFTLATPELLPRSARPNYTVSDPRNARQGFFEEDDFRAMQAELPEPLRPVMEFGYLTGWRVRSEVLPLTWDRIDFKGGTVRLEPNTTKNKDGREIPFDVLPELVALLQRQREYTTAVAKRKGMVIPWVFHREGKPIKDYKDAWYAARERAARDKRGAIVRPVLLDRIVHDFRRTAVRNLVRSGVPQAIAMKITGHKTVSVFIRYAIVDVEAMREGLRKLAAFRAAEAAGAR